MHSSDSLSVLKRPKLNGRPESRRGRGALTVSGQEAEELFLEAIDRLYQYPARDVQGVAGQRSIS